MPDEFKGRAPSDRTRINVDDPSEVLFRRKEYGCTEQQLRQAVSAVGVSATKVRQHFNQMSRPNKRWKIGYD